MPNIAHKVTSATETVCKRKRQMPQSFCFNNLGQQGKGKNPSATNLLRNQIKIKMTFKQECNEIEFLWQPFKIKVAPLLTLQKSMQCPIPLTAIDEL